MTAALPEVLGSEAVTFHDPVEVDGCALTASVRPADGECLAALLRVLGERKLGAVVRGGGSRLGLGNPPRGASLLLSTERIAGVTELDAGDGVVHVLAGTRVAVLRQQARASGWELPLDAPGCDGADAAGTVGGVLASGAFGPRRLGFGPPRDCVLGLEVALASGERTRCGGRVVKNVTGYDMAKLYTGSLGTLGVIEAAWLRLRARPEAVRCLRAAFEGGSGTGGELPHADLALAAARRETARAAAWVSPGLASLVAPGARGWGAVVELAGVEAAVRRDAEWLTAAFDRAGSKLDPEEAPGGPAIAAIRDLQASAPGGTRARIAALPSALPGLVASLRSAGAELIVHPGLGVVYAFASAKSVEAAVRGTGGDLVFEELGLDEKRGRDVFGDPGALLPVIRSLKERFDPERILNPGRFQGAL